MSDEGARFAAARYRGEALLDAIRWWETSMNHYLRAGECLRAPASASARRRGAAQGRPAREH